MFCKISLSFIKISFFKHFRIIYNNVPTKENLFYSKEFLLNYKDQLVFSQSCIVISSPAFFYWMRNLIANIRKIFRCNFLNLHKLLKMTAFFLLTYIIDITLVNNKYISKSVLKFTPLKL